MKPIHKTLLTLLLGASLMPNLADSADIQGGAGIGYTARLVFQKNDAKPDQPALVLQSGQVITPPQQDAMQLDPITIPATASMAWNDPAVNPTGGAEGYGWTHNSRWFLIDLSALKPLKTVYVQINLKREANAATPGQNDIIPALTVWRGYQDMGAVDDWYPNTFQASPAFWAWKLAPFTAADNPGYATAYGGADETLASVMGKLKLQGAGKDFLSVAVGGDSRDASNKHPVNFRLEVNVKKKMPGAATGGGGGGPQIDSYGCDIGNTCWHPQMNHCMSIPLCDLPEYLGQCLCPK
jgi:hypothetical protein